MQWRVLGASGSMPGNGQPCSGYLVTTATTRLLVDCGFGVGAALTAHCHPTQLDGVVVTHRHLDHSIDLLALYSVLRRTDRTLAVAAAPEVADALSPYITPNRQQDWEATLPITQVAGGDAWQVGDLAIEAFDSDHTVPTVSLRVTGPDGSVLAYSSDSAGGAGLGDCARDADVALFEASWQDGEERVGDGHMTAATAAGVARAAGARRLALTHLRPHLDPAVSRAQAMAVFGPDVTSVHAGVVIDVGAASGVVSGPGVEAESA